MNNNSKKNIWIINEYAGSPYHGMEYRHYYLSKELIQLGYHVTIISASYSHLFKQPPKIKNRFTLETIEGIHYLWIKVPSYSSSHSKKRVLKWLIYTISLFFLPLKKLSKPDYIIVSPMQTMPIYPALRWAKRMGSKLIFEVKDIWPLSIQELGGYSASHPFIKWLKYFEKMAIEKSDAIVSVLANYGQYLQGEGYNKHFYYIPNGVDTSETTTSEPLDKEIKKQIPSGKFIVAYTGTLGRANALNYLIDAAKILQNYQDIYFLIVGNGSEKEKLKSLAKNLNNLLFLPSIPKKQIQSLLQQINVCYIGLENKHIFQYGISPNKLFDYMLSEKPIICAINSPNNPVEQAQCGISILSPSAQTIAESILQLYHTPSNIINEMGKRGKQFVIENHNFHSLATKYHQLFSSFSKIPKL
ncbi:MAG: glycosyltransferase family 4 protein [Bacteroidia bacterium]|nr:glycosyltransferase family 4 protein [Bacteroidia bacterium]